MSDEQIVRQQLMKAEWPNGGSGTLGGALSALDRLTEELRVLRERHTDSRKAGETILRLRAELARKDAALSFYAAPENHRWQQKEHEDGERYTKASSLVDEDGGERARAALSQETN